MKLNWWSSLTKFSGLIKKKSTSIKMMERGNYEEKMNSSWPKATTPSVKLASSLMTSACTAANRTSTLAFIDDFAADWSSRMNAEVYGSILGTQILSNASKHNISSLGRTIILNMWPKQPLSFSRWGRGLSLSGWVSYLISVKLHCIPIGEDQTKAKEYLQWQRLSIRDFRLSFTAKDSTQNIEYGNFVWLRPSSCLHRHAHA